MTLKDSYQDVLSNSSSPTTPIMPPSNTDHNVGLNANEGSIVAMENRRIVLDVLSQNSFTPPNSLSLLVKLDDNKYLVWREQIMVSLWLIDLRIYK